MFYNRFCIVVCHEGTSEESDRALSDEIDDLDDRPWSDPLAWANQSGELVLLQAAWSGSDIQSTIEGTADIAPDFTSIRQAIPPADLSVATLELEMEGGAEYVLHRIRSVRE